MSLDSTNILKAQYDNLIEAKENIFIATKNGKQGIIDINGRKNYHLNTHQ